MKHLFLFVAFLYAVPAHFDWGIPARDAKGKLIRTPSKLELVEQAAMGSGVKLYSDDVLDAAQNGDISYDGSMTLTITLYEDSLAANGNPGHTALPGKLNSYKAALDAAVASQGGSPK